MLQMNVLVVTPRRSNNSIFHYSYHFHFLSNYSQFSPFLNTSFRTCCSKKNSQPPPQNNDDAKYNQSGDKFSTDWDKAWSSFKKQGKKTFSSQFSPNKYVTWNPRRSNYPLSEEVDPIKKTERSNLMLWTSLRFTLGGAIVIVSLLLIYTILAPTK